MQELLSLFLIGLALSMDAFSLSLAVGTTILEKKKRLILSLFVGCLHFCLPLLGLLIGSSIANVLRVGSGFLIAAILLLIAFEMIRSVIFPSEKDFKMNFWGMSAFALSVSFDSFSIGLGINFITSKVFLGAFIFAVLSFTFTLLGLNIGHLAKKHLGKLSIIIGAILLIVVAIITLCK